MELRSSVVDRERILSKKHSQPVHKAKLASDVEDAHQTPKKTKYVADKILATS